MQCQLAVCHDRANMADMFLANRFDPRCTYICQAGQFYAKLDRSVPRWVGSLLAGAELWVNRCQAWTDICQWRMNICKTGEELCLVIYVMFTLVRT